MTADKKEPEKFVLRGVEEQVWALAYAAVLSRKSDLTECAKEADDSVRLFRKRCDRD